MDEKKKDKIITIITIAIVAVLMIAMAWTIMAYSSGDMAEDNMYILTGSISSAMFVVVIIYAIITMKQQSNAERYKELMERMEAQKKKEELMGDAIVVLLQALPVVGKVEVYRFVAHPCCFYRGAVGKCQLATLTFRRNGRCNQGIEAYKEKEENPMHC